jgi:hypothetical protein
MILFVKGVYKMQKLKRLIFTIFCLILAQSFNQADAEDALIQEIEQTENRRIQAMLRGDADVLERILSEELTYTHSHGKVETKQEFLNVFKSGKLKYKSIDRKDVKTHIYGNVALITGRAMLKVNFEGKDFISPVRFTAVYVKQDGIWQMVAWQSTTISSP